MRSPGPITGRVAGFAVALSSLAAGATLAQAPFESAGMAASAAGAAATTGLPRFAIIATTAAQANNAETYLIDFDTLTLPADCFPAPTCKSNVKPALGDPPDALARPDKL